MGEAEAMAGHGSAGGVWATGWRRPRRAARAGRLRGAAALGAGVHGGAQRKELLEWVKIGVAAAEQLYKGQGRGEEKKKYVLEFLASMGFTVDEEHAFTPMSTIVGYELGGQ